LDTKVYSVSEITQLIRDILEDSFPAIWIEGEVSNYRPHHSGHLYFTLKDPSSQISCVMWRSRAASVPVDLEDGIKIKILGNIRVYEKAGRYQLDVLTIQPTGMGELQILFEQLKRKLLEEGLFESTQKKPLPKFPQTIGIITSPTGAAIRDIISVLDRRAPSVQILLRGVKVQGDGAAREIADAVNDFNDYAQADVIILGRGGGSFEDLWPFNEEVVARAIFESRIPIISAVGHEIDFTISDFVADVRAATPSAAAEIVVLSDDEIREFLKLSHQNIVNILAERINLHRSQLHGLSRAHAFRRPESLVRQYTQRVDELSHRMGLASENYLRSKNENIIKLSDHFSSLNPDNVLKRGYSMTIKDGLLVKSINNVDEGDKISIKLMDGILNSSITSKNNDKKT
jgi:exodeoxyribonuclease VII large subunit